MQDYGYLQVAMDSCRERQFMHIDPRPNMSIGLEVAAPDNQVGHHGRVQDVYFPIRVILATIQITNTVVPIILSSSSKPTINRLFWAP